MGNEEEGKERKKDISICRKGMEKIINFKKDYMYLDNLESNERKIHDYLFKSIKQVFEQSKSK